jgi:alkane 1-monooxygenase
MTSVAVDRDHDPSGGRRWRDARFAFWPLALVVPLLPLRMRGLVDGSAPALAWFLTPIVVFGIFPIVDTLAGLDRRNPPEAETARLESARYYRWVTYAYIPLQYLSLVLACSMWAGGDLAWWQGFGLATSVGLVGGIAINTAHELGHKRPALERWLSKVALAQTAYGHFQLEHNRGHHAKVSTPEDPASARLGESFYEFLPRTVVGSLRSALRLERAREERLGQRFWDPRNELLNAWVMTAALFAGLVAWFGAAVLPWLVLQAVLGFSLLEVVNYIEHYGLLRRRRPDGRYERCRPEHSWNASNVVSNLLLFQLQRHSDHHAYPTRRYQVLRHHDDVPQLPTGYAGMIVLAVVPPVWRRVMDRRVVDFYDGDVTRANLHPRARNRLLARWGGPRERAA